MQSTQGICYRIIFVTILISLVLATLSIAGCTRSPLAGLIASVTTGTVPLNVNFTNTSKNADEFQWDFGDGATMTTNTVEQPVTHNYTTAGTHMVTLVAIRQRDPIQTDTMTLTVTIEPGPISGIRLNHDIIEIGAGQSQSLIAEAVDAYDNPILGAQITWDVGEGVGTISNNGVLTAATEIGSFPNGIMVSAQLGSDSIETTTPVTIVHGPLIHVKLTPTAVGLATGWNQQFTAEAVDIYDNPIPDAQITWEVSEGVGTISDRGLFTAGTNTGTFYNGVVVTAEFNDDSVESTASIIITEPHDNLIINSVSPPDGTTISVGQSIDVTASVSYSLASSSHANIVALYQNEAGHYFQFAQHAVFEGSGEAYITGNFIVPNRYNVRIMVHLRLPDLTVPVNTIAVTYLVEGIELTDAAATIPGTISDMEGDVDFDFVDIINVEVTLDGNEAVAQMKLSELPEQLTFNQAPDNYAEYGWDIFFDLDGDPSTGGSLYNYEGAEYVLSLRHWVRPGSQVEVDTLLGMCQANVLRVTEDNHLTTQSNASVSADYATNTLTIWGTIPNINADSRYWAVTYYWDPDLEHSWQDIAPDIRFSTSD